MQRLPYKPHTERWAPGAVHDALEAFTKQDDRSIEALDTLLIEIEALGHATVLHIDHDKNEVPYLIELLRGWFIIDHDTGAVFCWCAEYKGYGMWGPSDVLLVTTYPERQTPSEIEKALSTMARHFGLFLFPPRWYEHFPLCLFVGGDGRDTFVRYLNTLYKLGCL